MDYLRYLAFEAVSTPDPVSGISVLQAACIEGNFEDFQIITSFSPSLVDTMIALGTPVLKNGRSEYAKKTPEEVVTMQDSPSHHAIRDLLQKYTKATENTSLMHRVARQGSVHHIRRLVARGKAVNAVVGKDDEENDLSTPLGLAAAYNKLEVVEELLSQGADVHAKDGRLFTAAHRAAMNGRTHILLYLLDKMDKQRIFNQEFRSIGLLHAAAYRGHTDTAAALISFGADVNEEMNLSFSDAYKYFRNCKYNFGSFCSGLTPFLMAAAVGQVHVAELLVSKGANIHTTGSLRGVGPGYPFHSAVYYATESGHLKMLQYLVKVGLQVPRGTIDRENHTLLHMVKNVECAHFFIEHGLDVNALAHMCGRNLTPLHTTVHRGDITTAEFLIKHGAYVEQSLPLHSINYTFGEDPALVRFLIEKGCSVNRRDDNQKTPLHWAVRSRSLSFNVSKVLIAEGADVNAKDNKDRQPLHYAIKQEGRCLDETNRLLLLLLEHGSAVNSADYKGNTPLHCAAKCLYPVAAQAILNHGGSLETANDAGQLPLHVACCKRTKWSTSGLIKVVEVLIDFAVSKDKSNQTLSQIINSKDKHGRTVLHEAARTGNVKTIQFLLDHGSDVNAVDSNQQSVLQYVDALECKEVVKLLLAFGANPNVIKREEHQPKSYLPQPEKKVQTEIESEDEIDFVY